MPNRLTASQKTIINRLWKFIFADSGYKLDSIAAATQDADMKAPFNLKFADMPDMGELMQAVHRGTVASARLRITANPSNTEAFVIGGHTFTYVTTLGAATAGTQIAVLGSASLARAATLDAINGVANASVVVGTGAPPTTLVVADVVDTDWVRIRQAVVRGGAVVAGPSASCALSKTLAGSGNIWNLTNLNASPGNLDTKRATSMGNFAVTAAMITAAKFWIELPFTPVSYTLQVRTSAGVLKPVTEAVTIDGDGIKMVMGGGGTSADFVAGDIVNYVAYDG